MGCLHVRLDSAAKFDTIHFRHHDITDNEIGIFFNRLSFPFFTIRRFHYPIKILQLLFQESTELLIIFYQQQFLYILI